MEFLRPLVPVVLAAAFGVSGCGGATRAIDEEFPAAGDWFGGPPSSIAVLPGDEVPSLTLSSLEARASDTAKPEGSSSTAGIECGSHPVSGCSDGALAAALGVPVASASEKETTGIWSLYDTPSLRRANEHLKHSLADRRPQLLISHALVSRIRERTAYDAQLKSFRGYPEEFVPEGPFNGVVEIELMKFGLTVDGPLDETVEDPRVALEIGVRANVYSMRKREFVRGARGRWEYLGRTHRLSELTAENGRLLNEELERAATSLARHIVN
ncbi:MAG TPA: hypothetical protein VLS27_02150 [Gammaproteobacteria bacterium]|nr:hypothetical protein [Gammaproteobacteria bacterium]